jgi:hypothetical protein
LDSIVRHWKESRSSHHCVADEGLLDTLGVSAIISWNAHF